MRPLLVLALLSPSLLFAQLPENAIYRIGGAPFQGMRPIQHSALSSDGKLVAGSSEDRITLWDVATGKVVRVIETERGPNLSGFFLHFSPDGKKLAYGSPTLTLELYDVGTGEKLGNCIDPKANHQYTQATFSADGQSLFGFALGNATVWHVESRTRTRTMNLPEQYLLSPSREGNLCVVFKGEELEIRSLPDGTKVNEINHGASRYFDARFDSTGRYLLVLGRNEIKTGFANSAHGVHPVHVYEARTGKLIRQVKIPYTSYANDATVSADGKRLLVTSNRSLYVWDLENGKLLSENRNFSEAVRQIHLLPDGKSILVASGNRLIRTKIDLGRSEDDSNPFQSRLISRLSPDGKLLALADGARRLELWDANTGKKLHALSNGSASNSNDPSETVPYRTLAFTPEGSRLTAEVALFAETWDTVTGKHLPGERFQSRMKQSQTESSPGVLHYSPKGDRILKNDRIDLLRLFSVDDKQERWAPRVPKLVNRLNTGFSTACWTPDGASILVLEGEIGGQTILSWTDLETGKATGQLKMLGKSPQRQGRPIESSFDIGEPCMSVNADGWLLALTTGDDAVQLVNLRQRREIEHLPIKGSTSLNSLAFSPDGRWLVLGDNEGFVRLIEVASRQELMRFVGHEAVVLNVGFFPDGKRIYSSGVDTSCIVWNSFGKPDTNQTLEAAWNDLSKDGTVAFKARAKFLSQEKEALAWFEKHVKPAAIGPEKIAQWLIDLDAERFRIRERAFQSLSKLGDAILPELQGEMKKENSETKSTYLKKLMEATLVMQPLRGEELLRERVTEILSRFDSKEAKELRGTLGTIR